MDQQPIVTDTLAKVIDFCHQNLFDDKSVFDYLTKIRKLSLDTIEKFKLGAFPNNLFKLTNEIDSWDLQKAFIVNYSDGRCYSKFIYNRVIIPIYDVHNRPIGIIGRTLLNDLEMEALNVHKYDNTRFSKGSCLFGLNLAKDSIREADEGVIVEGNFDVITAHQKGYTNVVAASGSWVTKKQFSLIGRYTKNVNIMFDNDQAGQKSTKQLIEKVPMSGIAVKKKDYPETYKDPDEYFGSL